MVEEKKTEAAPAPKTVDQRVEALEGVIMELIGTVEELAKSQSTLAKTAVTKPKGLFGGKRTPTPMKDLKTGNVYPSMAAVGKALATEAGADPLDTMAYYTVIRVLKMPDGTDRFVKASEEEGAAARAEQQKKIDAEVAEMNKKLQEEEAAPEAAPAKKPAPGKQPKK